MFVNLFGEGNYQTHVNPSQVVKVIIAKRFLKHYTSTIQEHKFLFFKWKTYTYPDENAVYEWKNFVCYSDDNNDWWSFDSEEEAVKFGKEMLQVLRQG